MEIALTVIHGCDYLFSSVLIGVIVFRFLILPIENRWSNKLVLGWRKICLRLITFSFICNLLGLILSVHEMSESWEFQSLWTGLVQTSFAHIWIWKLIFLIIFFLTVRFFWESKKFRIIFILLALMLPFANVLTSHAASFEDYLFGRILLDSVHFIAAGVWFGGIIFLRSWLKNMMIIQDKELPNSSFKVVHRFSGFAIASTAVIGISGFTMAWLNGVSLLIPWKSLYGNLISVKLIIFTATLFVASFNHFLHLRSWSPENESNCIRSLCRNIEFELILIFIIFSVTAFLTGTALPV